MLTDQERKEFRLLTQGTPEWLMARTGRVTASRCADVIGKNTKGKYYAARHDYLMELVVEHITKRAVDRFVTQAMEWGIEQQPFAQAAYEMNQDVTVQSTGLIVHPENEYFAASPDGLIDEIGLVEFKCPTTRVHLEYLEAGSVPEEYIPQMNAQLACMPEREYCDFVSFDPRVPFGMQLFVRRHYRDKERITQLEAEVDAFLVELGAEIGKLTAAHPVVILESIAREQAVSQEAQ